MTDGMVKSLGVGRFLDWRTIEAAGAAGGVLICWDKRSLELLEWEEGQFSMSCKFRTVENGAIWVFTGVYGPFTKEDRECLWEEFRAIRGLWGEPWCVMDDLELVDLPLQGGSFTWSGGFQNQAWARLDRFMVSPSWLDQFRNVTQKRLSRHISDHFPIIIEGGGIKRGPSPFRFENMWLKVEGFKDLLRSWWQGMSVSGRASYRLATKLKVIKQKLKVWNREVFGNLESNKMAALQQVDYWDQVEGEQDVRNGIVDAFQRLLTEDSEWKADIRGLDLNQISQQEADTLELPFTEEEVHSALMGMNGDKAPGPDGFTGAFWQLCWEFVKEEVLEMFKDFHEQKAFLKSLNTTFLVLIPKKGAEELGDFRPISLVGGLYKLLAKVLANRIKNVVGKVVSSDQNAFVMDRQILDASLIANEFLMRVMQKMGFGVKWREWIWSCISTGKFSVLINGEPAGFFSSSKGLRQGDPISPYLFIMGMEVLSAFIRRAVEGGCISGCRIQRGRGQAVNISHLLFADDAIVFCEARKDDMTFLSWILCWFEAASGLRINLAKSEIIPVGEVEEILEMTVELGCKVGQLPSTYLGLPLGAPNKAVSVWDGVEERMRWKLALWKRQYISKGGRIALIKSTLASMPLYQMSLFRMPRVVARRLEKLQRDFLWGGGSTERKAHLVNWERVCVGKEKGGLGLRKLVPLNKALLGKWVWRFANAKEEMWKCVLVAKYGQEELGWRTKKGTKIRFWKDPWCGEVELAHRFPQLFNVAAQRSATVGELWDYNSDQGSWNLRFSRGFNDWELNMVDELLQIIRSQRITLEEDLALWKGGKKWKFEVKEAYELLISHSTLLFPKKGIWVENVPSKLVFFAWEATWGRVLTLDRPQKRGWQLLIAAIYAVWMRKTSTIFLYIVTVARVLWGIVLGLVGAQWVFPETVKEGDVGCGKTVVAFLACMEVIGSGYQAAFMVPTELLALQHYEQLINLLENMEGAECKPSIALLTGSSKWRHLIGHWNPQFNI
ncbi:LINE-1 reverse transcriptase-like [Vitis vinifera]|uniref:LINE-1 reverse transcriptase-like n=1 Tax=Vitis vinifera TaxID=29760 RepID=A0A438C135_VITVI|nr:LINE-1 reverse transcriptase-like [Vitis vinifera]